MVSFSIKHAAFLAAMIYGTIRKILASAICLGFSVWGNEIFQYH